ncbi:SSI family serine proteinase inhibitor [Streptomyces sp. T12]|uniref:SSI family serine proteinase inhibitor n=1 Tax=Streptomyces sp. T12 TaxID=477697 RepID=UPI002366B168|nr:SSI family serine proteinase inhibitor [Streptomyces sp. T12]WDF39519.1 SSI family serine proteinase inhibitor [Streptomyces sp. T12]
MLQVNRSAPARRLRRVLLVAAGSLAAVGSAAVVPASAHAQAAPLPLAPPTLKDLGHSGDHLTVTVRNVGGSAGGAGGDRTYELSCHPAGGDHPDTEGACAALDRGTRWGKDVFAPTPQGGFCTMQYGGPATAHVTGTWAGRPVDARYDRSDGCQIARWDRLVPLLPDLRAQGQRS